MSRNSKEYGKEHRDCLQSFLMNYKPLKKYALPDWLEEMSAAEMGEYTFFEYPTDRIYRQ